MLMALHDAGVTELYTQDPAHEVCWILDAATRERHLSDALLLDLKVAASKLTSRTARLDVAMLLANPYVLHVLLRSACAALLVCLRARALPSDVAKCLHLRILASFLGQACNARRLHALDPSLPDSRNARRALLAICCPWLLGLAVDQLRQDAGQAVAAAAAESIPAAVRECLKNHAAARRLTQAWVIMRVQAQQPYGLGQLLAALAPVVDASADAEADFIQSLVSTTISGLRGANATTTKWLATQFAVSHGFLCCASRLGLIAHLQALRFLEAAVSRMPVPHVLEFLTQLVANAAPGDYTNAQVELKYIAIVELLVPDKVSDEEIGFVLDYLHIGEDEEGDDDDDENVEEDGGNAEDCDQNDENLEKMDTSN